MRRTVGMLVIVTAIAAMLFGAASAQASRITIGSPMEGTFMPVNCDEPCMVIATGSGDPEAVVTSPVNGAIVAWHLEEASPSYQYSLRVVTPGAPGIFTGAGTSAAVAPTGEGLETFSTDLPVQTGQQIGIDLPAEGTIGYNKLGEHAFFAPPLADGTTAETFETTDEYSFNAEILPAPTIGLLGATSGPTAGGTSVVIAGSNFADVKSVLFGSTAATYGVDSEGQITATAPPGTAGEVPVTVTTIAGTATAPQKFNYTAPPATITNPPPACKAPNLKGKKLKAAKKAIKAAHCKLGHVVKKKGVTAKTGKVVKQRPKAGTAQSVGAKVGVTLG